MERIWKWFKDAVHKIGCQKISRLIVISPEISVGATGPPEHATKMQKQITLMTQHTQTHARMTGTHKYHLYATWVNIRENCSEKRWSKAVTVLEFFFYQTLKNRYPWLLLLSGNHPAYVKGYFCIILTNIYLYKPESQCIAA